jgi:hypothetical protein
MISKSELSDKILNLLLQEMPKEYLTMGTQEQADEYIDVFTDTMTAVTAKILVAYIGRVIASNPEISEDDISHISDNVHHRLANHVEFEANDLMSKLDASGHTDA